MKEWESRNKVRVGKIVVRNSDKAEILIRGCLAKEWPIGNQTIRAKLLKN